MKEIITEQEIQQRLYTYYFNKRNSTYLCANNMGIVRGHTADRNPVVKSIAPVCGVKEIFNKHDNQSWKAWVYEPGCNIDFIAYDLYYRKVIVWEIKSRKSDYLNDEKYKNYYKFADYFTFILSEDIEITKKDHMELKPNTGLYIAKREKKDEARTLNELGLRRIIGVMPTLNKDINYEGILTLISRKNVYNRVIIEKYKNDMIAEAINMNNQG